MNKLFRIQEIKKDKILAFFRLFSERVKAIVSEDNQDCRVMLRGVELNIHSLSTVFMGSEIFYDDIDEMKGKEIFEIYSTLARLSATISTCKNF